MDSTHSPISRSEMLYLALACLFCLFIILANLITVKCIAIPFFQELAIPCGLLIYPFTFLISDLVTEIFGANKAKYMVYLGFALGLLSHGIIYLSINLPPHPNWISVYNPLGYESTTAYQAAYSSLFGLNGIAIMSSIAAYVVAQILDIRLFSFLKEMTRGRFLWLRSSGSTLTSQMMDTLIVNILFLYCGLKLELNTVIDICLISYLFKVAFTVCNIPVFYLLVAGCKRFLGNEHEETIPLLCHFEPKVNLG